MRVNLKTGNYICPATVRENALPFQQRGVNISYFEISNINHETTQYTCRLSPIRTMYNMTTFAVSLLFKFSWNFTRGINHGIKVVVLFLIEHWSQSGDLNMWIREVSDYIWWRIKRGGANLLSITKSSNNSRKSIQIFRWWPELLFINRKLKNYLCF